MKTAIHPETFETKVHCNGCDTSFTAQSTVKEIEVEICSNCHPFYTGKQKLVDTANRVAKFNARREAKAKLDEQSAATQNAKEDPRLAETQAKLQDETTEAEPTV
jgi:large subunit ribosomal protein L31